MARAGLQVKQNPQVAPGEAVGNSKPDYRIDGHLGDNYRPTTTNPENIAGKINDKSFYQGGIVVVDLESSQVTPEAVQAAFRALGPAISSNTYAVYAVQGGRVYQIWP
jgi:hypothetical protein